MIKFPCAEIEFNEFCSRAKKFEADFLRKLYFDMLRIRLIEEAIGANYHKDQMKSPVHLAIGQEAVAVGCSASLDNRDLSYCSHRTHGHYLAKGGDLNAMMAELHCRETGCAKSLAGSMHLLDKSVGMEGSSAIVGGAIPIATGFALSLKLSQANSVAVVYLGDAATEEGVHWESLNFAVLKKLPIIFVCENNFYSVCTPIEERQPENSSIVERVRHFGLKATEIHGNDVLSVFETMKQAVDSAKAGEGPQYIVANTYRWCGHHGASDDSSSGYRDVNELKTWVEQDPIRILEKALLELGVLDLERIENYKLSIKDEVDQSFEFALSSKYPTRDLLFQVVYAN